MWSNDPCDCPKAQLAGMMAMIRVQVILIDGKRQTNDDGSSLAVVTCAHCDKVLSGVAYDG